MAACVASPARQVASSPSTSTFAPKSASKSKASRSIKQPLSATQKSKVAEVLALAEAGDETLHKVLEQPGYYISMNEMEEFNIVCTSLDIETCQSEAGPEGDAQAFIERMPMSDLESHLNEARPWEDRGYLHDAEINKGYNQPIAHSNSFVMERWMDTSMDVGKRLIDRTPWISRYRRKGEKISQWRIPGVFWVGEWTLEYGDRSMPHTSCFISDDLPMKDDCLSIHEVFSILQFTKSLLAYKKHYYARRFRIFPITIFSASGHDTRIVQGYVCGRTHRVYVRKSKIIRLAEGEDKNMKLLLSWALGTPVGKVRWDDTA